MGLNDLEAAYKKTIYACPTRNFKLIHDENNTLLDAALARDNYGTLCILTAYNPRSEVQPELENVRNQLMLKEKLDWLGYEVWEGVNQDPMGDFPDEATWWVLGMPHFEGLEVAREWHQNAFMYYKLHGKTQLIWCNYPS